jgi:hypothetical protein
LFNTGIEYPAILSINYEYRKIMNVQNMKFRLKLDFV